MLCSASLRKQLSHQQHSSGDSAISTTQCTPLPSIRSDGYALVAARRAQGRHNCTLTRKAGERCRLGKPQSIRADRVSILEGAAARRPAERRSRSTVKPGNTAAAPLWTPPPRQGCRAGLPLQGWINPPTPFLRPGGRRCSSLIGNEATARLAPRAQELRRDRAKRPRLPQCVSCGSILYCTQVRGSRAGVKMGRTCGGPTVPSG